MFATASLLTSFVAGIVALFAPCCIGFLLPSYLGTIFQERRRIFLLTTVFALGIFTIFLPIGLGIGAVGAFLQRYHNVFFYGGAVALVSLGVTLSLGYIPMLHVASPSMRKASFGGIYGLGVMSGIGSACCAPVFAGVAALSVLSASALGGATLAGAYVLGMVAPLFVLSWVIDQTKIVSRFTTLQKRSTWRVGRFSGETSLGHMIAGAIFAAAGVLVAWLTRKGLSMDAVVWRDAVQVGWVESLERIAPWLGSVPEWLWFIGLIATVAVIVVIARRSGRNGTENGERESMPESEEQQQCH